MTFSSVVDKEVETPGMVAVVSCRTLVVSGACFREDWAKSLVSGAALGAASIDDGLSEMTFSSVVDREVETPGMVTVVSCRTLVASETCFREDWAKPLVSGAVLRVVLGAASIDASSTWVVSGTCFRKVWAKPLVSGFGAASTDGSSSSDSDVSSAFLRASSGSYSGLATVCVVINAGTRSKATTP